MTDKVPAHLELEIGSFRDKANRVFYYEGRVYRALTQTAFDHWQTLSGMPFFHQLVREGKVIPTWPAGAKELPIEIRRVWPAVLRHERIPLVSYPYEWTFSMLQEAALLQLEILEEALNAGMTLKDASSYNIQWIGTQPVFIDISSFIPAGKGRPWPGYRQFCQMFLFPLLLQAYHGIPFQPWLRGSIDGIAIEDGSQALACRFYKRGVATHVLMHSWLQKRFGRTQQNIQEDLAQSGFQQEMVSANVSGLKKLIQRLSWKQPRSPWSDYTAECNYTARDYEAKQAFVRRTVHQKRRNLVWDMGCNSGDFSSIAGENAEYVAAIDADTGVLEKLFRDLRQVHNRQILPLLTNVADASGGLGWQGKERKALTDRGRPDLLLCLALVHHLSITANIPISELIRWLAGFGADLLIEFISPKDPMAKKLLRNKDDNHGDYEQGFFEMLLRQSFIVERGLSLAGGKRFLYSCRPKKSADD